MFGYLLLILGQENGGSTAFEDLRPFMYMAAVVLAALLLMKWTQRRVMRSQQRKRLSVKQLANQTRGGSDIYGQIGELMGRLADLSRQINGQIDTRIAKLEILMRDADQMIAQLERKTGKNSAKQKSPPAPASSDGAETIKKISEDFRQLQAGSSETAGLDKEKIKGPEPVIEEIKPSIFPQNNDNISIESKQISEMDQQGMSAVEIAQELNRPIGEIELILALKGKKNTSENSHT